VLAELRDTRALRSGPSCGPRLALASVRSAYGHRLDGLHMEGLVRALPSVCGERVLVQ
jgi:chorismate mutase